MSRGSPTRSIRCVTARFFLSASAAAAAGYTLAVEAMKAALQTAGKTFEIKFYPGAPHGFHADYRPSYRKEAAEDAWNQMQAWFKKYKVLS